MALAAQKISGLTAATLPLAGTVELEVNQGGASRKATLTDLQRLPVFTLATRPAAATAGAGSVVYVSDGTKGRLIVSTGAAWQYMDGSAA